MASTYSVKSFLTQPLSAERPATVDMPALAAKLEEICNELDGEGYDVVNVVPVAIGESSATHAQLKSGGLTYVGDVGFSPTGGMLVVGKRR